MIVAFRVSDLLMGATMLFAGLGHLQAAEREGELEPSLSPEGKALAAEWSELSDRLREELVAELPVIEAGPKVKYGESRKALTEARRALVAAERNLKTIEKAKGLVNHARDKWISGASKQIAMARRMLRDAKTMEEKAAAQNELILAQKDKQAGIEALRERNESLAKAKQREAEFLAQLEEAQRNFLDAQAAVERVISGLELGPILQSDSLDHKLAKFVILRHAKPENLARFVQHNPKNRALVDELLSDGELLVEMAAADGARNGNYGAAMAIYRSIQKASKDAKEGHARRLALGIALEHASPVEQRNPKGDVKSPAHVDPVKRYLHYESAFRSGELDPGFDTLSVWEYRFVVSGQESDDLLKWGREMLRNYRPDHLTTSEERWRYVQLVRSEINWGSGDYKNDREDLQFVQNILMNGGTCGRRAVMGRFILRAFGIPTIARPQKGHASLVRWTSEGWEPCLGGDWGGGWTKTPYGRDLNFLASSQARATGEPFMQVMRAHWTGEVMGESRAWGLLGKDPGFWNGVALYTQKAVNAAAYPEHPGEAEPNGPPEVGKFLMEERDREITVGRDGVITIPAVAATESEGDTEKIIFMRNDDGGAQMHYRRVGGPQPFQYRLDVPEAGKFSITAKVVTPRGTQSLLLVVNGGSPVEIELPHTVGLWALTEPETIKLRAGRNTLSFNHQFDGVPKGFTIQNFTLNPIEKNDSDDR